MGTQGVSGATRPAREGKADQEVDAKIKVICHNGTESENNQTNKVPPRHKIQERLAKIKAIFHNCVEAEVDQGGQRDLLWQSKTLIPRKVGCQGYLVQEC